MSGDGNPANDTARGSFTPLAAKTFAIYYRGTDSGRVSKNALISAITANGTYVNNYDTINADTYTGSLDAWKTVFALFDGYQAGLRWTVTQRDAMRSYLDNSTSANRKTLLYFDYDAGFYNNPASSGVTAADTVLYSRYLKARYIADDWYASGFAASGQKFKGVPGDAIFGNYPTDSINGLYPDLITPVNGGLPAFIPITESGNGDSCIAVYYSGAGQVPGSVYNSFLMTNPYHYFKNYTGPGDNPNTLFDKIIVWVAANDGILPVELASFTSAVNKNDVTLKWNTTSEQNNKGFDIERKSASGEWTKISSVQGNGTSNNAHSYSFEDKNLATGNYNYRLKQIDFNGNYEYFNLSNEVVVGVPSKFALSQNYPNPFNPTTSINFELPVDNFVTLKIYDMTGREVMQLVNEIKPAGYYTLKFDASKLSSGMYFYKIQAGDFNSVKKMVLIK